MWRQDLDHPVLDALVISLSELVTNVHEHAAACRTAEVRLALVGGWASVGVHDRDPKLPPVLAVPGLDACGGRGLPLVRDLAAEVGGRVAMVPDEDGGGKTIRVELPVMDWLDGGGRQR